MSNVPQGSRKALVLRTAAFICSVAIAVLVISLVERATRERAEHNRSLAELAVVETVLPPGYDNQPALAVSFLRDPEVTGSPDSMPVYTATRDGETLGRALTVVAPDGYVDVIRLLIGLDTDGRVIAVRVLEHRETPGLGDRIEAAKSPWIEQFSGRTGSELQDWALRRDGGEIDQLSGATITSRAVLRAVQRATAQAPSPPAD